MLATKARFASARPGSGSHRAPAYRLRHQRSFGRGRVFTAESPAPAPALTISDDVKLFASTFAAGFLFVTVFLA